jgi:hypothetical protein
MASLNLTIAEIAALVGDPGRTNVLAALLDSIMAIASAQAPPPRLRPSRVEERMRTARTSASAQSLRGKLKLPAAGPVTGQRIETMIR